MAHTNTPFRSTHQSQPIIVSTNNNIYGGNTYNNNYFLSANTNNVHSNPVPFMNNNVNGQQYQHQQQQIMNMNSIITMNNIMIHNMKQQILQNHFYHNSQNTHVPHTRTRTQLHTQTPPLQRPQSPYIVYSLPAQPETRPQKSHREHGASASLKSCLRWIIYNDQIDDFAEMLCRDSLELKVYVINRCAKHSATYSACIKWAKKWNLIHNAQCKESVYHALCQSQNSLYRRVRPKDYIHRFDDLQFCDIDLCNDVLFVNNRHTFALAKQILLNPHCRSQIGLDLELECIVKQFPIKNAPKHCQILQIATVHKSFLFDLERIPNKYDSKKVNNNNSEMYIDSAEFDALLYGLFYSSNVLKVAMCFDADLKLLRKQYPYLKCFKCIMKCYFELETVLKFVRSKRGQRVFNIDPMTEATIKERLSKTNAKREGGLATVVRHTLHRRLSKKEQLSNWARRPLRLSQMKYAALDARVQLDIWHRLQSNYPNLIENEGWITDLSRF